MQIVRVGKIEWNMQAWSNVGAQSPAMRNIKNAWDKYKHIQLLEDKLRMYMVDAQVNRCGKSNRVIIELV